MKLATIRVDNRDHLAFSPDGTQLFDLGRLLIGTDCDPTPPTMLDLIESGPQYWSRLRAVLAQAAPKLDRAAALDSSRITWQPPVLRPSKICCLALNNSGNADRIMQGPKHPASFVKPASSLLGHLGTIELQPVYGRVHPEPELAVVIGKRAKKVSAAHAYDYVFGYTIHNDITSPTMRAEDTFHYRAIHPKGDGSNEIAYIDTWTSYPGRYKGSDTFACMGPWLVTTDEIPDPHALRVSCSHRGALVTDDNTVNLFYKVPEVIEFLSNYMTLLPGDIISMGTALKKSAAGGAVQNIDLNKLGGPVSVSIEGLGTLENSVRHA
jgi:2-keto-4-pentenoate hydratase/2-oxohepta-3-ene-1,7-dioic acid hydratase in catechol pathway